MNLLLRGYPRRVFAPRETYARAAKIAGGLLAEDSKGFRGSVIDPQDSSMDRSSAITRSKGNGRMIGVYGSYQLLHYYLPRCCRVRVLLALSRLDINAEIVQESVEVP